ncbi:PTS glucitol/sorbitol transporter subunit IIA [Vagococcus bubulae]|nr:PTS glucitol/sorbitol transporter subunit IIA [Vagococcus bubulae]
MIKAVVKQIGEHSMDAKDEMIILFGEKVTDELEKFSVIQKIETDGPFNLEVGGTILFDEQEYHIVKIGSVANRHLDSMGHVSLMFKNPEGMDELSNAIYLEPYTFPTINEGTVITYR